MDRNPYGQPATSEERNDSRGRSPGHAYPPADTKRSKRSLETSVIATITALVGLTCGVIFGMLSGPTAEPEVQTVTETVTETPEPVTTVETEVPNACIEALDAAETVSDLQMDVIGILREGLTDVFEHNVSGMDEITEGIEENTEAVGPERETYQDQSEACRTAAE